MVDLTKGFDLRTAAERGAWLQLLHPGTNEELGVAEGSPCRIKIQGADSMAYEEAAARTVALRSKKATSTRRKVSTQRLLEAAADNAKSQSEELAAITLEWENIEWDGEPLEFTTENAIKVYSEHRWIRDQVIEFFGDRTNYLGNA